MQEHCKDCESQMSSAFVRVRGIKKGATELSEMYHCFKMDGLSPSSNATSNKVARDRIREIYEIVDSADLTITITKQTTTTTKII
jgi:hypothetical protein